MDIYSEMKEKRISSILGVIEKGIRDWFDIVKAFGLDNKDFTKWQDDLQHEFETCVNDCNQVAQEKQHALLDKIELLLQTCQDLCMKLSIKLPQFTSTNKGLYHDEQCLIEQIKVWQDEITLRSTELEVLKSQRDKICHTLGIKKFFIRDTPLPSREDMAVYMKKIEELQVEKSRRMEKFLVIQKEIAKVAHEIEFVPSLCFEKNIVHGCNLEEIQLNEETMSRVTDLHNDILQKRENIELDLFQLRENVLNLWKILDEDVKYCNDFTRDNVGTNSSTMEAFKQEVNRCEKLRKANLKKFVVKMREELVELWNVAAFSQAKRAEFRNHLEDDLYTEDLLTLHDFEINRVKDYLKTNHKIFELMKQRQTLYARLKDLEQRANAPDRFKNRGGQLLREEKERKAVSKKLPLIEDQLLELVLEYELIHGTKFEYGNDTIEELIRRDRENIEQNKQEKQLLLSARKQELKVSPSTSRALRAFKSPNGTQMSTRRMLMTPNNTRTPLRTPKTAPVKRNMGSKLAITKAKIRLSVGKKKRIAAMIPKRHKPRIEDKEVDYKKFKKDISSSDALCSTFTPLIHVDSPETVERKIKQRACRSKLDL